MRHRILALVLLSCQTIPLPVLAQPQTSSDQDPKVLLRPPILPADTRPKSDDEAKFEKSIKEMDYLPQNFEVILRVD